MKAAKPATSTTARKRTAKAHAAKSAKKRPAAVKPEGIHEAVSRKRDLIVSAIRRVDLPSAYAEALARMEDHLRSVHKRCTVERRFVLEALYRLAQPVDTSTLHQLICAEKGAVALATVYTTLELLVQLQLARRVELVSHGMTFFERTLGTEPHGFVACSQCGNVSVLAAPELLAQLQPRLPRGFRPDDFTLVIHGLCSKCQRKANRHKAASDNT